MTALTENDLKELKDLINNRFDAIKQDLNGIDKRLTVVESKIDRLFEENNFLKIEIATIKTDVKAIDKRFDDVNKRIDDANKRFDDLNSRFNIMTVGFLSIIGVLVTGVLGAISKLVFFSNP